VSVSTNLGALLAPRQPSHTARPRVSTVRPSQQASPGAAFTLACATSPRINPQARPRLLSRHGPHPAPKPPRHNLFGKLPADMPFQSALPASACPSAARKGDCRPLPRSNHRGPKPGMLAPNIPLPTSTAPSPLQSVDPTSSARDTTARPGPRHQYASAGARQAHLVATTSRHGLITTPRDTTYSRNRANLGAAFSSTTPGLLGSRSPVRARPQEHQALFPPQPLRLALPKVLNSTKLAEPPSHVCLTPIVPRQRPLRAERIPAPLRRHRSPAAGIIPVLPKARIPGIRRRKNPAERGAGLTERHRPLLFRAG
jgi:hypothetical protein